jgi:hypothetical protein
MSWLDYHSKSEQLAALAEIAARQGDCQRSVELYQQAAEAEVKAIDYLDIGKARTVGITVLSAVALSYKAQNYTYAQQLAYKWLSSSSLPSFATEQLQTLLQTIWSDVVRAKAGVKFSRGEVLVSVKGGQVVLGGAPLDLIVRKVEGVEALFYRTTEFLKGLPHRKHGPASHEVQNLCRPWLFQTTPGSYQFAVAIQESAQQDLFATGRPSTEEISSTFLRILRASIDDPDDALPKIVPDGEYRGTFLKLARNLAPTPTGQVFEELEIKSALDISPITISITARKTISETIHRQFPKVGATTDLKEETLLGILRAVHLDQDWLEVTVDTQHIRVLEAGETVDDVIGPMINRQVIVQTLVRPNGQHILVDIQAAE